MSFYQATKAFLQVDFKNYLTKLVIQNICSHQYIIEASQDNWAISHFQEIGTTY